jgi:hypothetical protein
MSDDLYVRSPLAFRVMLEEFRNNLLDLPLPDDAHHSMRRGLLKNWQQMELLWQDYQTLFAQLGGADEEGEWAQVLEDLRTQMPAEREQLLAEMQAQERELRNLGMLLMSPEDKPS